MEDTYRAKGMTGKSSKRLEFFFCWEEVCAAITVIKPSAFSHFVIHPHFSSDLEEMQRNNHFFQIPLTMLILLAITLLPFKMCLIQQNFRNESSSPLLPPSPIRSKRQYSLPSGQSAACGGCPSKFTPVNCKCTSTANDDLLCRCDRAILANLREEPDRPQCPCRRGNGGADLTNFRGEISELTSRVQNLGGVNAACHPICHQSCLNSCTRPVGDSYRDRYAPMANDIPRHQSPSPSPSSPSSSVQHQYPLEQMPGCQPSLCRTNCLRACSRILDGQKGGGDFGDPRGPSTSDPYQENLGGIEPPTHYEVRPADPFKMPEYPQLVGKSEGGMPPSSGGGNCQCSPGAFCDCPETCFPLCFDSCDSNCNNNQPQGQAQRRICAQSCHYECQRSCAEKQRQKQQQQLGGGGNELGGMGGNQNSNGGWTAAAGGTPSPPQIADNNDSDGEFQQGNNGIAINNAVMPENCLAKCPKSCETACSMTNEDPSNCVPACVSICAQSCSRGPNQFDHHSPMQQQTSQSPQIPSSPFPFQQFQQNIEGNLQQQQAQLRQQLLEGLERSKMQTAQTPMQQQIIPMNGPFAFEMNAFKNGTMGGMGQQGGEKEGGQEGGTNGQQMGRMGALPPTMFLNDGMGNNAPKGVGGMGMAFSQPCAPLCQPECKPECNRRYMEERRGQQRPYRGIGQFGNGNLQQNRGGIPGNKPGASAFQGNQNAGQIDFGGNQNGGPGFGQFESKPSQLFPPHYILPLADDLNLANGSVDDFLVEGVEGGKQVMMDDLEMEALLRPQNETGNSTQIPDKKGAAKIREEKQRTVKQETLTLAKPWKGGKPKNGGQMEEFFKRRMGKFVKEGTKKGMKGEQISKISNKWPLGENGGKGADKPKLMHFS